MIWNAIYFPFDIIFRYVRLLARSCATVQFRLTNATASDASNTAKFSLFIARLIKCKADTSSFIPFRAFYTAANKKFRRFIVSRFYILRE